MIFLKKNIYALFTRLFTWMLKFSHVKNVDKYFHGQLETNLKSLNTE